MSIDFSLLDEARECRSNNPQHSLELANQHIAININDTHGYFSRCLTFSAIGNFVAALSDCTQSINLEPNCTSYRYRGEIYRALDDHESALVDLNRAHDMNYQEWLTSFGPHLRADTLAKLGRLDEALADAALIRDDHWMPEHGGLPGGGKQDFIAEIKRRASAAKRSI